MSKPDSFGEELRRVIAEVHDLPEEQEMLAVLTLTRQAKVDLEVLQRIIGVDYREYEFGQLLEQSDLLLGLSAHTMLEHFRDLAIATIQDDSDGLRSFVQDTHRPAWMREVAALRLDKRSEWTRSAIERSGVSIDALVSWDTAARMVNEAGRHSKSFADFEAWIAGRADAFDDLGTVAITEPLAGSHRADSDVIEDARPYIQLHSSDSDSEIEVVVVLSESFRFREALLVFEVLDDATNTSAFVSNPLVHQRDDQWLGLIPAESAKAVTSMRRLGAFLFLRGA